MKDDHDLYHCPKCNRKSLYYADVAGRWRCPKCGAFFTRDMTFICYSNETNVSVTYYKDGRIRSIHHMTGNLTLFDEVVDRQKQTLDLRNKIYDVEKWWSRLSDKERIEIYETK